MQCAGHAIGGDVVRSSASLARVGRIDFFIVFIFIEGERCGIFLAHIGDVGLA